MQIAKAAGVKAEINVTPLVDVVLVLLIIFMVITPMLQKGPAVKLPTTENPPKKPDEKNQILIAIEQSKTMWIEKEKMSEDQFATKIKEVFERNQNSTVVIKGDARLTYGDVKKAMLKVKEAGFKTVGLIADKRDKS